MKGLTDPDECANVVALIQEVFAQIDINGDDQVDWEEFTSFCIEMGMMTTKQTSDMDEGGTVEYIFDETYADRSSSGTRPIQCIEEIKDKHRIVVVEEKTFFFNVYTRQGVSRFM